jgi:hypothetical protein
MKDAQRGPGFERNNVFSNRLLCPRISSLKGDVDLRDETPRAIADENASPGQCRGGLGVMAIAEEIEKWVVARSSR